MPLNKLDNFLKNVEGRILYVSPSDLDATDSISNSGNSQTAPFKTVQRALIEAARFSYQVGNNNDITEKTTILLMPGDHLIDNRPGFAIKASGNIAKTLSPAGVEQNATEILNLDLESNFDLTQEDNILYKFNSIHGGVIVPRGTSIVGLDLRKTKIRPKYVPNPTNSTPETSIFRITGACYFWQFSIFDGKDTELVYTNNSNFTGVNLSTPTFSHHKLTCFEYADGVNVDSRTGLTDLNMYYHKLSVAYGTGSFNRDIVDKFPASTEGFASRRPEFEIVGAFAADPISIVRAESGSGGAPSNTVTVTTQTEHNLDVGTPIKIRGVIPQAYNVSSKVTSIDDTNPKIFTYSLESFDAELVTPASNVTGATVVVETDTVGGASPYIFNISLRSVFGMNGMHADGSKATGFRSMVVAQFTGVSLQKDDRSFVKYDPDTRTYNGLDINEVTGEELSSQSSATDPSKVFHLDSNAIYRSGWETRHVKISNDSILQIVSVFAIGYNTHFEAQSGADASITNSNSNFGQLALVSDGFKRDAFQKDDRAFITHIIPPRAIATVEEDIDWVSIDMGKTDSVGDNDRLYLFGFDSEDVKPPSITQGFRIGAKIGDVLNVDINGTNRTANILMEPSNQNISSVKEYSVDAVGGNNKENTFQLSVNHHFSTGEKLIIISDDGDLPEKIEEKTTYFAIVVSNTEFKLASSKTNAENGESITLSGGTNLKVLSRVTDKESGDIGHPVQFDTTQNQWYVNTQANSSIYTALNGLTGRSEPTFVKRISDTRSLDEKIYKLRLSIPKEIANSKNPENGFIIQESSNTGIRTDADFVKKDQGVTQNLTRSDFDFDRNLRFISSCTFNTGTKIVTIRAERPHNLSKDDVITIRNVTDSSNTVGAANSGFNGKFVVSNVVNDLEFEYSTGNESIPNFATNDFNVKNSTLPRFERTDLKSNVYLFRNNIISEFIESTQDGIYQVFALNSSNYIPTEYTGLNYSQNVVDLYPQLDRDNVNENPQASKSFAVRSPLGQVVTNDPLKSVTRETTDKLIRQIGLGKSIFEFADSTTTGIVSFTQNHNLAGIVTATVSGGSGYTNGTYENVKVFTSAGSQNDSTWNGTLAKVVVSGNSVTSCEVTNAGSGMLGQVGHFDKSVIGNGNNGRLGSNNAGAALTTGNVGISSDLVLQSSGIGTITDSYFRITGVIDSKRVSVVKSNADVNPIHGQYGFIVAPSSKVDTESFSNGVKTITTFEPHGLVAGNRFQLNNSSNVNQGSYIVKTKVGVTTFTFELASDISVDNGFILKHGLSANDGASGKGNENLGVRGVELFDIEHGKLASSMDNTTTSVTFDFSGTSVKSGNLLSRFKFGSYIQVDEEIMRVASNILGSASNNQLTVIRGVLGTLVTSHVNGSIIKKVKPFPIQFNRPSILRASGHTFEYLGYGPGNYSTALPQVQIKTISEKEEFLSQSQERAGGAVVYTGMNNKGDFYIGNQKKSALTGEETSFDTPIPSVAGEDPGRLSVVFDESTIKDRIVVEGGKSKTVLSEFDGPVTFNNEVQFKDVVKVKTTTESLSPTTGALVISGGVGVGGTVNLPDNSAIRFGNDADLQISHTDDVSLIRDVRAGVGTLAIGADKLFLRNKDGNENYLEATDNGSVKLFFDFFPKFETTNTGAIVTGILTATSLSGDGSGLTGITTSGLVDANGATRVKANTSGAIVTGILTVPQLNISNTSSFTGVSTFSGGASFPDNSSLAFGDSDDTTITHTTSNGTRIDHTGDDDLRFRLGQNQIIFEKTSGENFISMTHSSGAVNICHNGDVKLKTETTGVRIEGLLDVSGDIMAFNTSDLKFKSDLSIISSPLEKVGMLTGYTYMWNQDAPEWYEQGTRDTGLIAQDIEKLGLPGLTRTRDDGDGIAVYYPKIIPVLVEAIKELSAKVKALENK